MDSLPPEIVLMIVESLTGQYRYDEIVNLQRTNIYFNDIITAEKEKIFTGIRWLAWLYTKPCYIALFTQQIQSHYGLPIKTIISSEQNHIPDIRNNLQYSSNVAIDQFLNIRTIIRNLLKQPITELIQDINVFNKELDFLCDLTVQFMTCILDRIAATFTADQQKWSANIKLIENINFVAGTERSQFIAFFNCLNRLNTIICHITKLLTCHFGAMRQNDTLTTS
jgi:hypothetical protein